MRLQKYLVGAVIIAGTFSGHQVMAQTTAGAGVWSVGVGTGQSKNHDYDCFGCGPIGSVDDDGVGYKLFVGYQFGRYFAISGGFAQLADTTASGPLPFSDQLEVNGPYVALMGIVPMGSRFHAFSTLGAFRWNQDVTFNGASDSFSGTDLTFGAGVSYNLTIRGAQRLSLQTEWQRFNDVGTNDDYFGHIDNYSLTTLNVVFRFR